MSLLKEQSVNYAFSRCRVEEQSLHWVVILVGPTLALVVFRRRKRSASAAQLPHLLTRIDTACRAGDVDPLRNLSAPEGAGRLFPILRRFVQEGLPIRASVRALGAEVEAGRELQLEARRLSMIVLLRAVGVTGIAVGCRVFLAYVSGAEEVLIREDQIACALAAMLLPLGPWLLERSLPRPWFWDRELTAEALAWLEAHVEGRGVCGLDVAGEIRELCAKELRLGVSLASEKRRLLEDWAASQRAAARLRMRAIEDLLPLGELLLIGLPAALILMVPVLRVLGTG